MLKASQARRAEQEQGSSEAGGSDSLKLQQMLRVVLLPLLALISEILVQHLAYKWEESFLSGDTKLRFMHSQSVFSLSVGRSKALKSQTYSQTKAGEVNWELILKNCSKYDASPLKSYSYFFPLPYSPEMCVVPAQCLSLIFFFKCPSELTIIFSEQNHAAIHPEMPIRFEVSLEIFQKTPKITALGLLLHFHFMASFYIL